MRTVRLFPVTLFTLMLCSAAVFAQDASSYAELPRFQQVTDRLYRGGQPREGGLRRLRELGIDTILNAKERGGTYLASLVIGVARNH